MNIIDNSIESIGTGNKRVRIIGVNKFENLNGESNKDGTEIHCRWYGCRDLLKRHIKLCRKKGNRKRFRFFKGSFRA